MINVRLWSVWTFYLHISHSTRKSALLFLFFFCCFFFPLRLQKKKKKEREKTAPPCVPRGLLTRASLHAREREKKKTQPNATLTALRFPPVHERNPLIRLFRLTDSCSGALASDGSAAIPLPSVAVGLCWETGQRGSLGPGRTMEAAQTAPRRACVSLRPVPRAHGGLSVSPFSPLRTQLPGETTTTPPPRTRPAHRGPPAGATLRRAATTAASKVSPRQTQIGALETRVHVKTPM